MSRLLRISFMSVLALFCTACVHEWPESGQSREVSLAIVHNIGWKYLHTTYEELTATRSEQDCPARYIIKVYPQGFIDYPVKELTIIRPLFDRSDFDVSLSLPPGEYDIYVWGEAADENGDGLYYNANTLSAITFADGSYIGNVENKDVFEGKLQLSVPSSDELNVSVGGVVQMYRPVAAFAFIATDLAEFVEAEATRFRSDEQGIEIPRANIINLSDYTVKFNYPGFLPSQYNIFSSRPTDAATGLSFLGGVTKISDDEALLGFDYILVNGEESAVTVSIDIYDRIGDKIASVPPVNVPTKRGRVTIVRGKFLTATASGGAAINPEFEGEYNIPIYY